MDTARLTRRYWIDVAITCGAAGFSFGLLTAIAVIWAVVGL